MFAKRAWVHRVSLGGLAAALALLVSHQAGWTEPSSAPISANAAASALSKTEADGIIFERQQIMIQLDKDAKLLGQIVAGAAAPAKLGEVTRSIAQAARDSVPAFEQVVPGGRSKPEVWSGHADFLRDMNAFATKADAMAKAGEAGNINAVTGLMIEALPCKECHDRYRVPKTS